MGSLEDLTSFLVEEIAIEGEAGISIKRLAHFVTSYHEERQVEGVPAQHIDEAFVDYTWRHLLDSRPDLRIGVIQAEPLPEPDEEEDEKFEGKKGRAKSKGKRTHGGSGRQREVAVRFVDLAHDERRLPRAELSAKHGDNLRLAASPEACWIALTGSHSRSNRITNFVLAVCESVARSREKGITMVELGKEFVHDQKSLFHFVKTLVELNVCVKIKSSYFDPVRKSTYNTNRMIHKRFLDRSEAWRISAEAAAALAEAQGDLEDEPDAAANMNDGDGDRWRPLTQDHFFNNEQLVVNRIKVVLRNAPNNLVAHTDMIPMVNLIKPDIVMRKKMNRLIDRLCQQGVLEKVSVPGTSKTHKDSRLHCVRLLDMGAGEQAQEEDNVDIAGGNEATMVMAHESIEWQMLQLLHKAGEKGMNLNELGFALSVIDVRGIESLLAHLESDSGDRPVHLGDYAIRSVLETVGRMKQTRFFTIAGYAARCRRDGIDINNAVHTVTEPEAVGGFAPRRYFELYNTLEDFDEHVSGGKDTLRQRQTIATVNVTRNRTSKPAKKPRQSASATPSESTPAPRQPSPIPVVASYPEPSTSYARPKPSPFVKPVKAPQSPKEPKAVKILEPKIPKKLGRPKKQPGEKKSPYVRKRDADGFFVNRPPGSKMTNEEYRVFQIEQREKELAAKAAKGVLEEDDAIDLAPPPRKRQRRKRIIRSETPEGGRPAIPALKVDPVDELEEDAVMQPVEETSDVPVVSAAPSDLPPPAPALKAPTGAAVARRAAVSVIAPPATVPKKRGRPPKSKAAKEEGDKAAEASSGKRGKSKSAEVAEPAKDSTPPSLPRPPDFARLVASALASQPTSVPSYPVSAVPAPAPAPLPQPAPAPSATGRKRGRPRKVAAKPVASTSAATPYTPTTTDAQSPVAYASQSTATGNEEATGALVQQARAQIVGSHGGSVATTSRADHAATVEAMDVEEAPAEVTVTATPLDPSLQPLAVPGQEQPAPIEVKKALPARRRRIQTGRIQRVSHSQEVREAELAALIARKGGIALNNQPLRLEHLEYVKEVKNDTTPTAIDRMTMTRTVQSMVDRKLLIQTIVTVAGFAGSSARHEVLYLPSVSYNSDQMRRFIAELQDSSLAAPVAPMWTTRRRQLETKVERMKTSSAYNQTPAGPVPEDEGDDVLRSFFAGQWRITAQYYGFVYGRMARAGILHQALVDIALRLNGSVTRPLSHDVLYLEMRFGDYLRCVAATIMSQELDDFLERRDARDTLLSSVPEPLQRELAIGKTKSREKVLLLVDILVSLRLITPIIISLDGDVEETESALATHWRIADRMPIYHLAKDGERKPLVSVVDLVNRESAAVYWQELRRACSARAAFPSTSAPEGIDDGLEAGKAFDRDAVAKAKWIDSPVMLSDQKDWIVKQVDGDPEAVGEDAAQLKRLAHVALVPVKTIADFIQTIPQTREPDQPKLTRQKAATKRKEPATTKASTARKQLAAKAASSEKQREKDWEAIVRRYEAKASGRRLDDEVAATLKSWFLLPSSNRMNAKQLEEQLERYLSFSVAPAPLLPPPPAAAPPRAIPSMPRPTQSRPTQPFPDGDVIDEMDETQANSQRHRWNSESNELLRDAYTIANVRAGHLDAPLHWDSIAVVFPHGAPDQIRQQARLLFSRPTETAYLRALEQAWSDVWLRDLGNTLRDDDPTSLDRFDIASHIEHLRQQIDKTALRSSDFDAIEQDIDLPDSIAVVEERWTIHRSEQVAKDFKSAVGTYWHGLGGTAKERVGNVGAHAFAWPCEGFGEPDIKLATTRDEISKGICLVKMLIANDANDGPENLLDVAKGVKLVEGAHALTVANMIRKNAAGNHVKQEFGDKFHGLIDSAITMGVEQVEPKLKSAEGALPWPFLVEDGQMVALTALFRRQKIDIDIDITGLKDALDEIGFNSRKGDDETIEGSLAVRVAGKLQGKKSHLKGPGSRFGLVGGATSEGHGLNGKGKPAACLVSDKALKSKMTDCTGCIKDSLRAISATRDVMSGALVDLLYRVATSSDTAKTGIEPEALQSDFARMGSGDFDDLVTAMVTATPPVFFWVGTSRPLLVPADYITPFTVDMPTTRDAKRKMRVMPRIWTDLDGKCSSEAWALVAHAVLKQVMDAPGISEPILCGKLNPAFERCEVGEVLHHLIKTGCIERRTAKIVPLTLVTSWADSRLFITGRFLW